jgi:hypothetical protein
LTELTKLSKFKIYKRAYSQFTQIIHLVYTNQTQIIHSVYTEYTLGIHRAHRRGTKSGVRSQKLGVGIKKQTEAVQVGCIAPLQPIVIVLFCVGRIQIGF